MKRQLLLLLALVPCMAWTQIQPNDSLSVLVDQSQFVTEPGAFNGYDISRLHPEHVQYGPGINFAYGYMLADDFTLEQASRIEEIEVYGYQSYSTTNSTFTGLYIQIYNGNPMQDGQVVWGDLTTNRMTSTAWTECYRCGHSGSNPTNDERPIMSVKASDLGIELEAGTYFLAWGLTGDSELYGPYGIPVTIAGQAATGDALQYDGAGWWRELYMDQNYSCSAGAAFLIKGTTNNPTSVLEEDSNIAVYPTVTRNSVKIEAKELRGIAVMDLLGRKLFETSPRTDAYDLDLGAYDDGLYIIRITTANGVGAHRVRVRKTAESRFF